MPHPIGKRGGAQPTAHHLRSVPLPRENHPPILDGGDQLHFGVDVAVCVNLTASRRERINLLTLDALQPIQEIQPDLTNRTTPLVSYARFSGNTLLGNHAEAEADQHGGRKDQGDEEEDYLSPVWL